MAYQSLYRKYRPQTFSDVMGQEHVTRTLQNALATNRVAHGYLFTGTRGTAKTTVARLLAKSLNCLAADRPTSEPCNRCAACQSITAGACIDVIEMDAASHRGVADMEEVRKAVGYGPMEMRYKVFIIDEAHQLSSDAKDAFLKTLEEPPDNVVFILATTEPQAIPITIRSRCQQFDFKRGTLHDIAARLRYVLDCESVSYTPDAINLVARGAEGSWRDALSLLEQVLAFAPSHIAGADVDAVLGTLDGEMLARVTRAVAEKNAPGTFALAGELLDAGKEARTLLRTLSAHFRDLLIVSVGGPAVGMEFTPEEVGGLQNEARAFTPAQMMRAMEILNEAQGETRWNNQHRLLVELAFLKLMTLGDAPAVGKGANASALPQTVFATAPIVFSAPPLAPEVSPPLPASGGFQDNPHNPLPAAKPPVPAMPLRSADENAGALPSEVSSLVVEDTLPAAFFAADADETDDEDEYVPPFDEADETDESEAEAENEDDEAIGADTSHDAVRIDAVLAYGSYQTEEADAEAEPVDDGPSLFEELPNPTPPFLEPVSAPAPVSHAADDTLSLLDGEPEADLEETPAPLIAATPSEPEVSEKAEPAEAIVAPSEPDKSESDEPEVPSVTLDEVMRAWPEFLRKAGMVSKKTEFMMVTARPVSADKSGIEIAFGSRANFEIMNTPVAQGFVRNVLLRCLGASHIAVRFVLDESAPAEPKRAPTKEKKTVRDPLAELDALEKSENNAHNGLGKHNAWGNTDNGSSGSGNGTSAPVHHSPPAYGFSGGGSNGSGNAGDYAAPPPRREPAPFAPSASFGTAENAPRRRPDADFATAPAYRAAPVAAAAGATTGVAGAARDTEASARHALLLENSLVQDVLSVFGGEITDE